MQGGRLYRSMHCFSVNGEGGKSTGASMQSSLKADAEGAPGERFRHEISLDAMSDALDTSLNVPMAFFGTLETVRARLPEPGAGPDLAA